MKGKIAHVPTREGAFAVDVEQVISTLHCWLEMKYALQIAYLSFSDRTRGPWRDSLVGHWKDHYKDERGHTYALAMKIVGLGGDPQVCNVSVPQCECSLKAFFLCLIEMELKAIECGRQVIQMSGDNTALRLLAEEMVLLDSHHLDDLKRMAISMPEYI